MRTLTKQKFYYALLRRFGCAQHRQSAPAHDVKCRHKADLLRGATGGRRAGGGRGGGQHHRAQLKHARTPARTHTHSRNRLQIYGAEFREPDADADVTDKRNAIGI